MYKIIAVLFALAVSFGTFVEAKPGSVDIKEVDFCVKAHSDRELQAATKKCEDFANTLRTSGSPGFEVRAAFCLTNARGVGLGTITNQCGVYDVVLKTSIRVTINN